MPLAHHDKTKDASKPITQIISKNLPLGPHQSGSDAKEAPYKPKVLPIINNGIGFNNIT